MMLTFSFPNSSTTKIAEAHYCRLARQIVREGDEIVAKAKMADRTEPGPDLCLDKDKVLLTTDVDSQEGHVRAEFYGDNLDVTMESREHNSYGQPKGSTWQRSWHITEVDGVGTYTLETRFKADKENLPSTKDLKRRASQYYGSDMVDNRIVVTRTMGPSEYPDMDVVYGRETTLQYSSRKLKGMAPYAKAAWTTAGKVLSNLRDGAVAFYREWQKPEA